MRNTAFAGICYVIFVSMGVSQGLREDYERADALASKYKGLCLNETLRPNWIQDSSQFWFISETKAGKEFLIAIPEMGEVKKAFSHEKLAKALSEATKKKADPNNLPFKNMSMKKDGASMEFFYEGENWSLDLKDYSLTNLGPPKPKQKKKRPSYDRDTVQSPDGKWDAFVKNHNLYLRAKSNNEVYPLTQNGNEDFYYSSWVAWSPDSKKLATYVVKPGQNRLVHYIESSPKDQVQPKPSTLNYLKPGDRITLKKPVLFHVSTKKQIHLNDALFQNPYDINSLRWRPDSSEFSFYYNERGHQIVRVIGVNGESGKIRSLIEEKSNTFIDYAHKRYFKILDKTDEIIWASERDGWSHLYLYDYLTGRVKNRITQGPWVWRSVEFLDESKREICFRACGKNRGEDPYNIHYYKIRFDGSGLVDLTPEAGDHLLRFSKDKRFYVDSYSQIHQPPTHQLRRFLNGSLVKDLNKADPSLLYGAGFKNPEPFVSKCRENKYNIWGVIFSPEKLDKTKKYPVIEDIYAGPHGAFVPKRWRSYHYQQALAELGFIVVKIDGKGTSYRCRDFHHFAHKNLMDSGFPDRIKWIKEAAKSRPYMDITRVGVFGTSAGGQSAASAVFNFSDFYKVAVSSCGCHDNRMDKIWWNELWMGYPVGPHYAAQSNVTNAHKLKGALLLIVGELDKNVDPSSTLQVANALIKAEKEFDLLFVPGMGHSSGGAYGERKRRDFFVRHLLEKDPPEWNR